MCTLASAYAYSRVENHVSSLIVFFFLFFVNAFISASSSK